MIHVYGYFTGTNGGQRNNTATINAINYAGSGLAATGTQALFLF
jgi:hypothetical protein